MSLTTAKALRYVREYYNLSHPTDEDDFNFTECMEFLIHETGESRFMMDLGEWYYRHKQFDLAKEYYLLVAGLKDPNVYECLGYIYYYGRTGKPDYEKAFKSFTLGYQSDQIEAGYKLADMYKNGYYVEQNYDKYCEIIKSLYPKVKDAKNAFDHVPEIYTRLANIYYKEGKKEEAIALLLYAKDFLAQRMMYSVFFGNRTIMKLLVKDLYSWTEFDLYFMDLFDLYYILDYPSKLLIT